jgi:hypothetical protein
MVDTMMISSGLRIGFWSQYPKEHRKPFTCVGHYTGLPLGDQLPGWRGEQELMEGTLRFRIGVLFRPDLGKYNRLETIMILENYIEEMFDYEDWEAATG